MAAVARITPHPDTVRHLEWLMAGWPQGAALEMRVLPTARRKGIVLTGYFADPAAAAHAVARYSDGRGQVYAGLNPRRVTGRPDAVLRPARPGGAGSTAHILAITAVLLDFDPVRPSGVSSTDEELAAARAAAALMADEMSQERSTRPLMLCSGNGVHLLFRVPPQNPAAFSPRLRTYLFMAAARYSSPGVHLDTAVHDAPRIAKVAGTIAAKGPCTAERPHRRAAILEWADPVPATHEAETICSLPPGGPGGDRPAGCSGNSTNAGPLARMGFTSEADLRFVLERCLFMEHCRQQAASLPEPLWYAMICNLAPFGAAGRAAIHKLSRPYPRYSRRETEAKITHALRSAPGPTTCATIAEMGFVCPAMADGLCPARAPAALARAVRRGAPADIAAGDLLLSAADRARSVALVGIPAAGRQILAAVPAPAVRPAFLARAARTLLAAGYTRAMAYHALRAAPLGQGIPAASLLAAIDAALDRPAAGPEAQGPEAQRP